MSGLSQTFPFAVNFFVFKPAASHTQNQVYATANTSHKLQCVG